MIHLVKLRASQLNDCTFCQHMHANEARSDEEIVNLTAAIVTINAWNRIAVGFHFLPVIKDL